MYYIHQTHIAYNCPNYIVDNKASTIYPTKTEAAVAMGVLKQKSPDAPLQVRELHGLYSLYTPDDLSYVSIHPSYKALNYELDENQISYLRDCFKNSSSMFFNIKYHFEENKQWITFNKIICPSQDVLLESLECLTEICSDVRERLEYITSPKDWI